MAEVVTRWKQFIENQPADGPLSSVILASWDRSQAAGVKRDPPEASFHRIPEDDLRQRLRLSADWLAVVRPHVEWLTAMYRHVPHVIYLTDPQGIVLHSVGHQDFIEGFGLSPGYDWSEARMGTNGAGTALAAGKPVAVVGPEHWVNAFEDCTCTGAPICGPDHEIVGAIDISTHVRDGCPERLLVVAHAAYAIGRELALVQHSSSSHSESIGHSLRFQLDLTRSITDNATTAIFMMDHKSRCTFMNPAAEQMTGFKFEEVKGGILHDFIHHHHPDGRPYPMPDCPIDRALPEHFEVRDHEDVFIRKNGEFFPVLCNARVIYKEGKAVGTVIEVRDTTKERAAAEALRRQTSRSNRLVESNIIGVIFSND
jgi:PAS domain S-box-containing protein